MRRVLRARRWKPPAAPIQDGRSGLTRQLVLERRIAAGGFGPEDVAFDGAGRVVTGAGDGRIWRLDLGTGERTVVGETGGRPLGVEPCADGSVLVCDHDRGLLRVRADGSVEVLVDTVDGERLSFASNVAQESDGTIWFTASCRGWSLTQHLGDMFEHSESGRLFCRAVDGGLRTVLTGLKFANGLALAPDGSHLIFAETSGYRVMRYWLAGPRTGEVEPLVENLPGFPDNLSIGSDGLVWVAIAAPRNALLDRLLPLPGVLRTLLWNLPKAIRPAAEPVAWVMAFDLDGRLVHDLRDYGGSYGFVTSVAERDGTVVIGSLTENDVAVLGGAPGGS